jgi:hyperosmotically inducible protein
LVPDRGGAEFQTAGILEYVEDLKRGTNPAEKGGRPKDIFETGSSLIRKEWAVMFRYSRSFGIILILAILTTGCTTIYKSAVDKRSVGEQYDDEKITMDIRKKFTDDEKIKYFDISTYCYNGHVYLVGEYDRVDQKNQAVKLAREVEGVKSVTDYFLPKKADETCGTTTNLKLLAKVKTELIGDKDISSTQIEVNVLQCNVILLGLVSSSAEIKKAIAHAKAVEGVRSVKSFLKTQK